ncbi:MAG: hypothetical protein ACYDDU_06370 [Dermatophilaceae bacterium]
MTTRRDPFEVKFSDVSGPTHWPSLLPDDARQAWADLRDWVERLVDRFGLETRIVPPCWYRHNTLVEALTALRDHERICFAPNASPTGAVDWFRALREIEHRLTEACARTQCSVNEHRPDPLRTWLTDQDQWRTFVEADVHDREQQVIGEDLIGGAWHPPGTPPGPSP